MIRAILVGLLLLLAQPSLANPTVLYDGSVQLNLPDGFRPATKAEIAAKFPKARPPEFVFTDSERLLATIVIRRDRLPTANPPSLQTIGSQLVHVIGQQPGAEIRRHGVSSFNGRNWYAIEFSSTAVDQPIENLMQVTIADAHLVIVSANATRSQFAKYQALLRTALGSMTAR